LDFPRLADTITRVDTALRGAVAASVNRMLTMRNWLIGMYIVEYEQNGNDRAAYGENLIPRLAERLNHARGFSGRNLRTFREFYREYPKILQSVTAELSSLKIEGVQIWQLPTAKLRNDENNQSVSDISAKPETLVKHFSFTHFVELMRLTDPLKRAFYEIEGIKGCWSVPQLKRQIESLLYKQKLMGFLLRRIFNCAEKLFYYFRVKGMAGVERNDHADVVFKINAVTAFATHKRKTCFKKHLFRLGSGKARQLRQHTPQDLKSLSHYAKAPPVPLGKGFQDTGLRPRGYSSLLRQWSCPVYSILRVQGKRRNSHVRLFQ
jgi:hypothetical protein